MKTLIVGLVMIMALMVPGRSVTAAGKGAGATVHAASPPATAISHLPVAFEPNRGQAAPSVRFLAHLSGGILFLTDAGMTLVLDHPSPRASGSHLQPKMMSHPARPSVLQLLPQHMLAHPQVVGIHPLRGKVNYFIGNDPRKWHTDIPTYAGVVMRNVYRGIDLRVHGNRGKVEYDWVLHPGADPATIALRMLGEQNLRSDAEGRLHISTSSGSVVHTAPRLYQDVGGVQRTVHGRLVVQGEETLRFVVGKYSRMRTLIIDPTLIYSTYIGGAAGDGATSVAVGTLGLPYVTGETFSTGAYPTGYPTKNPYQANNNGTDDVFVTKLAPLTSTLVYSTYIGGSDQDVPNSIAVDQNGSAYIGGDTHSTGTYPSGFPTKNAFQSTRSGLDDAFVVRLSPAGNSLVYSTLLGGAALESVNGIAVGSPGIAYVAGYTISRGTYPTGFPTKNAFQADNNTSTAGFENAIVAKLNTNAKGDASLVYSTYLGGATDSAAESIAVDGAGDAYVAGGTGDSGPYPTGFPTKNAFQSSLQGPGDGFLTVFDPTGTTLLYSTYLGGSGSDAALAIAIDPSGKAYLAGGAYSTDFPTRSAFQSTNSGGEDAFVAKLDPSAAGDASLIYSTYLGGSQDDYSNSVAVDQLGNAYTVGSTSSNGAYPTGFPMKNAFQTKNNGARDAFVTELTAAGSGLYSSTYLGGGSGDVAYGVAVDASGRMAVAGVTTSFGAYPAGFPTKNAFQAQNNGGDAFVTRPACLSPVLTLTQSIPGPPKQVQITVRQAQVGLYSITTTKEVNATTSTPSFTRGTTGPVVVSSTKGDQNQPSQVVLSATSMSGCTTQTSFSF